MVRTLTWTPFTAAGVTREQTRLMLRWAMAQWGLVCGLEIVPAKTSGADISVKGVATNEWAGYAKGSSISISTIRKMTGRDGHVLGGVIIHEIGHTQGLKHTPQSDSYRDYCMHPWGPSDDWWSPEEVKQLQKKFGKPKKEFHVHEITYWGSLLKANRVKIDQMLKQKKIWVDAREKATTQATIDKLTKQIETQDKSLNALRAQSRGWKSIYSQKIVRWDNAKVPYAIVPRPTRSDVAAAEAAKFRPIRYQPGDSVCGYGNGA